MVTMNNNDAEKELKMARFSEVVSGTKAKLNVMTNELSGFESTLKIPAKTALVFELKK